MIEEPENLACKVWYQIVIIAVERRLSGCGASFLQVELDDWLTQTHVLGNFDHGRNIVHLARLVRIDTDVCSGKDIQKLSIRNSTRKIDRILQPFLLNELTQSLQPWP